MNYESRLLVLRRCMASADVWATIVLKPSNQRYFSGFETVTYSRPILTVVDKASCSMILPGLVESWSERFPAIEKRYVYYEDPYRATLGTSHFDALERLLSAYPVGSRIGIEMDIAGCALTDWIRCLGFELVDISSDILSIRSIKTPEEIKAIRIAAKFACMAVIATAEAALPGTTELEAEAVGTRVALDAAKAAFPDATCDASYTMCISGASRTMMPHALTDARRMEEGDVVLLTRQFAVDGYYADCQRTIFVGGFRTSEQWQICEAILAAQRAAIAKLTPGRAANEAERAARNVLADARLDVFFTHRLAKSSGLEAAEEPYIRFDSAYELKSGMVFNVMPSVYLPGVGGFRVSDTVLVTDAGPIVLTDACPRDPDDISAMSRMKRNEQ